MRLLALIFTSLFSMGILAQKQNPVNSKFIFNEGIYLSFEEFKKNKPSIREFTIENINGRIFLECPCKDSTGKLEVCTVENPWGYCKGKNVYISQGYRNMYFRLQVIGALIHYYDIDINYFTDYDYMDSYPYGSQKQVSENEKIIEWNTGNVFYFDYKSFSEYLKIKDPELYKDLKNSKRKRKMIYFFMLKYNEKHPVYID